MFKLLSLTPKKLTDGVCWYRQVQFFEEATRQGLLNCIFFNPTLPDDVLTQIINNADAYFVLATQSNFNILKDKRKPLIIDIDDNITIINPFSNAYASFGTEEITLPNGVKLWEDGKGGFSIKNNQLKLKKIEENLKQADLITTTTFKMGEWVSHLNKKVVVIPNSINFDYFPILNIKKDNIVRIGYALGSSHFPDLMSILPSLKKIMEKYPQVHYYHIGQWFGVVEKYIPKSRLHFYDWVSADGHGYRLSTLNLDIGLAPLTNDEFNTYKSSIKFYEYSALKIVTLAKDITPYNEDIIDGETGLLYQDAEDFEKKLEFLILNPVKRLVMGDNAYEYVKKYRNIKNITKDWAEAINKVIEVKKNGLDK